ncbi:hypothetical protein MHIR_DE00527 [Candidatus Doolittlea endobia]|uniref:Uncharacterized protein n=1 Tax=Candidatus Doolittlea endobia TaxID=1778262 RepID=A0A143WSS9_9ENTR|nr:hypothetical protein MHIR_DE00527 [Candidatus Doolittlea endobia]
MEHNHTPHVNKSEFDFFKTTNVLACNDNASVVSVMHLKCTVMYIFTEDTW